MSNTVSLGGSTFTTEEVIRAIQISDNPSGVGGSTAISDAKYAVAVDLINALRERIEALEAQTTPVMSGTFISKTDPVNGKCTYRVSYRDYNNKEIVVTFEVEESNVPY